MASKTVLTRAVRQTLFDARFSLPPTFLLPWTANLQTAATGSEVNTPPPSMLRATENSSRDIARSASKLSSNQGNQTTIAKPTQLSPSARELLPVLRAQGQIYISAHIHGKSYLLTKGDTLRLPFLMPDVQPGDTLRLNCALYLGSRDLTLKPGAAQPTYKTETIDSPVDISVNNTMESDAFGRQLAPHYIPNIAKGKHSYLDERLFVCRALVTGVESEPLKVMEKTKRRQRHVKHVKSKMRHTILKIADLQVRSLEEIDNGIVD